MFAPLHPPQCKSLPLCLAAILIPSPGSPASSRIPAVRRYVARTGNDADPGTRERPFATLTRARDAVRALKANGLHAPVEIIIRGGVYYLPKPLVLTPQDSGTVRCPITWRAAKGERVLISGGRPLRGWRQVNPGLWTTSVPEATAGRWVFRQLFVNEQRRTLARSPNEGFFCIAGQAAPLRDPKTGAENDASKLAFRFRRGDIQPWDDLNEIDAVILRNWESAMLPLASVDTDTDTVVFTGPMKWPFQSGQRYYVENVFAALDAPGEWYLDRKKGLLYYRPMPGEDMSRAEVVAPRLTQLLLLQGDPERTRFVEHVRFEGLSFLHADYRLEPHGHGDWQAAVTVPAVIQARGARFCTIERCEVAHVGTYGIWFERGCTHNRIVQCEIHDLGAGGVRLGEPNVPPTQTVQTGHNVVSNNFIHDTGHVYHGAVGVWIGQSSDNEIVHNEICDTTYTGVSVGWSWGFRPTACHRNRIEFNHIHHIAEGWLNDLGAIYTLGISTGTTIRNNLIHHVWGGGGIYPDEGSSGILIENNVVFETESGGFTMHYGRDDVVRNNVFAFGQSEQVYLGRPDKKSSLTFERNIVYFREGALFRRLCEVHADRNVYYSTDGEPLVFPGGRTFEQWRAAGYDRHSLVVDPRFVDAEHYNFRLRPDSPALKLGFKPIDLSRVGLSGDPTWVAKPGAIRRTLRRLPPRREPPPQLVDDGFESSPTGASADLTYTLGEQDGASIRVTDELAASGRKCLKFVDAPGLKYSWNPHMFYVPRIREGRVRLEFDLRFEPGAVVWHEWRDNDDPYHVGPSLGIDAHGQLSATSKPLMVLPPNQWIHFQIVCDMGRRASGTYNLTVAVRGQEAKRFKSLPCDLHCKRLDWLGFVSNATDREVFYVDNVKLQLARR